MKRLLSLLILLVCLPGFALGAGQYIVPHSHTQYLTKGELWEWSYESLGFILNEIFARHGYNFEVGKKYYNFFHQRPWYTPNENPDNSRACYPKLSSLEWTNEHLIKEVRAEMRALGTKNSQGKNYLDAIENAFDVLSGFKLVDMKPNQKPSVYSAPNAASYRGANGKASVSTNGSVYAAGFEGGWLLVMYETNNGSVRVGYIDSGKIKDHLTLPRLDFAYTPIACQESTILTDDPAMSFSEIARLAPGTQVTYLSEFQNRYAWAYVETTVGGQTTRGFVPASALDLMALDMENEDAGEWK